MRREDDGLRYLMREEPATKMDGPERRKSQRISISTMVKVWLEDFEEFKEYLSENLSTAGIFVKTTDPLPVGSRVAVEFSLFEGGVNLVEAEGRVVRVEETGPNQIWKNPGMAVEFTYIKPESKALIEKTAAMNAGKPGSGSREQKEDG